MICVCVFGMIAYQWQSSLTCCRPYETIPYFLMFFWAMLIFLGSWWQKTGFTISKKRSLLLMIFDVHYFVRNTYNNKETSNMFLFPDFYKGVHMFKRHENSFINSWNADDSWSRVRAKVFWRARPESEIVVLRSKIKAKTFFQRVSNFERKPSHK